MPPLNAQRFAVRHAQHALPPPWMFIFPPQRFLTGQADVLKFDPFDMAVLG